MVICPVRRQGRAKRTATHENHSESFDLSCPKEEQMILIVGYPTRKETREAAERGNEAPERRSLKARARTARTGNERAPWGWNMPVLATPLGSTSDLPRRKGR
jgi:hypothetical protein